MLSRRIITTAAIAAASLGLSAGPALAKGGGSGSGGGGGGQTAPAPAPTPAPAASLCPELAETGGVYQADGSLLFASDFPGEACLIIRDSPTGALSISEIRLATGWSSNVKSSGGGSSNKIDVILSNASTGGQHEVIIQPGKTVVR